ncbi:protein Niban-like [Salarias fasciatus]|uniref:Protein Niban-like n=1 Tax=Salarias fasciatus TaxID=181472 RepID=A0A672F6X5_SALFA|nr:protein Niban-like [Salarias fasciatus]
MGASSSGLLDETKISHIKGLVESSLQSFSGFYHQQHAVAYFTHLQQEVEPKKEGWGLLLTQRPQYSPEEVLYQSSVKFSCWDEQGKKCRERYVVLRRNYSLEIYDTQEAFSRGGAAKMVFQPAGASVFTTEEESRAHLEKTCAGILNGVKEDSSSGVPSPDVSAVYLHLPHRGYTCFLFQQEEERDHFLSALKTCIRHCNLDPWSDSSYESQAFARALRLYRQDKGCYESWEILLGTEGQVLASQVMEEVLPWLQSQLQSRVKGKKTERIRLWLATVQATYMLVLEQVNTSLEALRAECRQTASANQTLIRSNLDQITSSLRFLEQKVRDAICEEAEKVCSESVSPYMSSILEVLTEHVSAGVTGMRDTLHSQMNSAFANSNGGAEKLQKALSSLSSISLDECYKQVDGFSEKVDLKQRFGLSSTQRLLHSAHMEIQKLQDSAVYTLEKYLQSSAKQSSRVPVKMERAKERVLKQLDYDSRVVQRRLYEEALLEIALPCLTRQMDNKWKTELQQFEQYIFSDNSSFILVQNIYNDALRTILSEEIMKVVQDAAGKKSNSLHLDVSDLALSQYSLLEPTPPRSAPGSPAIQVRELSSAGTSDHHQAAAVLDDRGQAADADPQLEPKLGADAKSEQSAPNMPEQGVVLNSPMLLVTQFEDPKSKEASCTNQTSEEVQIGTDEPSKATESVECSSCEAAVTHDVNTPSPPADLEAVITHTPESSPLVSPQSEDSQAAAPQISVSPEPCAVLPVMAAADQRDESENRETGIKNTDEVQTGASDRSAAAEADESSHSESAATDDACTVAEAEVEITGSPDPSLLASPEPPNAQAGCDQPAMEESCVPLSPAMSDELSKEVVPTQLPSPGAESSGISLGSLSEAICCSSAQTSVPQTAVKERTDRAVYLTGEIKNNWLLERLSEEKQKEAAEVSGKEVNDGAKEEAEKEEERDVAQIENEAVDEGYRSSGSPAESTTALTTQREEAEDGLNDGETGAEMEAELKKDVEKEGNHAEGEKVSEEEALQSPPPTGSDPDSAPELLPDSVAVIRGLVTEITEVEEIITPPSSQSTL